MPTMGAFNGRPPIEPKNGALKAKMPPSAATSRYPPFGGGGGWGDRTTTGGAPPGRYGATLSAHVKFMVGKAPNGSTKIAAIEDTPFSTAYPAPAPHVVHEPIERMLVRCTQHPDAPGDGQPMFTPPKPSSYIQAKSAS